MGLGTEFSSSISGRRGSAGSLPASGRGELECDFVNSTSSMAMVGRRGVCGREDGGGAGSQGSRRREACGRRDGETERRRG